MYVCKRIRLCAFLLNKGFNYEKEEQDKFNPKFKIWVFKGSPELYAAVEEYYANIPQ